MRQAWPWGRTLSSGRGPWIDSGRQHEAAQVAPSTSLYLAFSFLSGIHAEQHRPAHYGHAAGLPLPPQDEPPGHFEIQFHAVARFPLPRESRVTARFEGPPLRDAIDRHACTRAPAGNPQVKRERAFSATDRPAASLSRVGIIGLLPQRKQQRFVLRASRRMSLAVEGV